MQLEAIDVFKSYRKGRHEVPVLRGVDLQVRRGEFVAIVGSSGSGKSTLLHLLGTLDAVDSGQILLEGTAIGRAGGRQRDTLRNRTFGMIFQFYHLLPELSALENVLAPAMIRHSLLGYWRNRRHYRQRAEELLKLVGLTHRLRHKPRELSGGESQRAAIARALLGEPRILLADEPTGNLDARNGQEILALLRKIHRERELTVVMVTHDQQIARQADRVLTLSEGQMRASEAAA